MKRIIFSLLFLISVAYGQNVHNRSAKVFYANDYGCAHDGATNDASAIRKAILAAKAIGGGEVHLGAGTYAVSATVLMDTSNLTLSGEGAATIILATADISVGIITAIPSTNPPTTANFFHDVIIKNLSIQATTAQTSGAAIYTTYTHSCSILNVVIGHQRTLSAPNTGLTKFFDGVHFENESNALLSNTQIYAWHNAVYFTGKAVGVPFFNTNNYDGTIDQNCFFEGDSTKSHISDTTYAIHIAGGTGGILIEHSNSSFFSEGIRIDAAFGINNNLFIGQDFAADLCGSHGIHALANSFYSLTMTGSWSSSAGSLDLSAAANGVFIESPQTTGGGSVTVAGGDIFSATGYGIRMDAGRLTASGVDFQPGNGSQNTTGDIYLGTGVTVATITGCYMPKGLTNAGTSVPYQWNNNGVGLQQFSSPTAQIALTSTSTTGQSGFYFINNSGNYLTGGTSGSAATGNFALGYPNANLSSIVGTGASALIIGTSTIKPVVIATNASGSVGPQIKWDSSRTYILTSVTNIAPLVIRGIASQTADYLNIQDAASVQKLKIDVNGSITTQGNLTLSVPGDAIFLTEGANGRAGQVALVAGTKAISIAAVTASSRAFITLVSQSGTTTTTQSYEAVCTSATLTINAVTNAGSNTVNTLDTSTLNYFIINGMNDWIALAIVLGLIRPLFRRRYLKLAA